MEIQFKREFYIKLYLCVSNSNYKHILSAFVLCSTDTKQFNVILYSNISFVPTSAITRIRV